MATVFNLTELKKLYKPAVNSSGEDNGQVTIIGGSSLFHGAPLLALKVASRVVDMVFFASPEPLVGEVAREIKSQLSSFIWVPWEEIESYIKKSEAVLIGPGFMRYRSEKQVPAVDGEHDGVGQVTRKITRDLLEKFPAKKWVIDAGSLQVMEADWIPQGAIVTPNKKEYKLLFGGLAPDEAAKKYHCIVLAKGPTAHVCSGDASVEVTGGNPGLTKGGTGDVLAGLTVALLAKNEPFLAAASASSVVKAAADELYKAVGVNYNADDLADKIPPVLSQLTS
jgi:NAD(P)H-hydrate epimerase